MKNLANCKPSEFLKQTNRIRKAVEKWLTATDVMNIRRTMPDVKGLSPEEVSKKRAEQANTNLSRMLDSVLDEHPDETLELLALLCFVEPEDVDEHPVEDYLQAISEMISNQAVMSFFTSLTQLGLMGTSEA